MSKKINSITCLLAAALVFSSSPLRAGEKTLSTAIPPEQIEGTPMPIKLPNVAPALTKMPTVSVPEETKLLSKGKPVTSSDTFPIIGEVSYITDGEKLGGEGYFVELLDGAQWVQIDLEASAKIEAIWMWHYHSQARAYHDVVVQISDDATFKTGVTTVYNSDSDGSSKLGAGNEQAYVESRFGKLLDVNGVKGRYVRFYSNGNTSNSMNHYIEIEVYGIAP